MQHAVHLDDLARVREGLQVLDSIVDRLWNVVVNI